MKHSSLCSIRIRKAYTFAQFLLIINNFSFLFIQSPLFAYIFEIPSENEDMDNSIYNVLQYFVTHSIKKSTFKHQAAISDDNFFTPSLCVILEIPKRKRQLTKYNNILIS